mgnify:CR=1 FL=1
MAKKKATKKAVEQSAEKPAKKFTKKVAKKSSKPRKAAPKKAKGEPTHDEIAVKAYEIWLSKGRPLGQDDANWAEAVEALKG